MTATGGRGQLGPVRRFQDLVVWQKAMDLVDAVYPPTRSFPPVERMGLASQMRRSGVSIPSNIAEGYGRRRAGDYARFLYIARGSLSELQTQIIIAKRQDFLDRKQAENLYRLTTEVGKLLYRLIESVERGRNKRGQIPDNGATTET